MNELENFYNKTKCLECGPKIVNKTKLKYYDWEISFEVMPYNAKTYMSYRGVLADVVLNLPTEIGFINDFYLELTRRSKYKGKKIETLEDLREHIVKYVIEVHNNNTINLLMSAT